MKILNYNLKYQRRFEKSTDYEKEFVEIKNDTKGKIEEFMKFKSKSINMTDLLLYAKDKIGKTFHKNQIDMNFCLIPLKYFNLELNDQFITFNYAFTYMETIIDELISIKDCQNYFINKKYQIDFLKGQIKGHYFELIVKDQIKKSKILMNKAIDVVFNFDSIVNFDKINIKIESKIIQEIKSNSLIFGVKKYSEPQKSEIKLIDDNNNNINFENSNKFKDINYYKNLQKEKKLNFETIENCKDKNILLDQKHINGACLDCGFLTGDSDKKIFVGIQIKCYDENTRGGNFSKETIESIKEKCKNIVLYGDDAFNCTIIEWHYLVIIYFEAGQKDTYLENLCKKKKIYIIYFMIQKNPHF